MKNSLIAIGVALAASLGSVSASQATIFSVIYTGTDTNINGANFDSQGLFANDPTGSSFTFTSTWNTSKGTISSSGPLNGFLNSYGPGEALLSASVTLDGQTFALSSSGSAWSFTGAFSDYGEAAPFTYVQSTNASGTITVNAQTGWIPSIPTSLATPYHYVLTPAESAASYWNFGVGSRANGAFDVGVVSSIAVYLDPFPPFPPTPPIPVPGVPEVSTWAMMLAGFAGLGFVGYRRNKAATLAA